MTGGLSAHVIVRRRGFVLDAEIQASEGETVAVMGPSGAGKSSLLGVLSGVVRVREGFVRLGATELSSPKASVPPQRRGVVLLGQDPHLFPHLSARDNVAFGLQCHGVRAAAARSEAEQWLDRVGMPDHADHTPHELSGGQQQRVALARALATAPGVLLLDEPLTGLDPETAGEIRTLLSTQLAGTPTITIFVTHNIVDAVALAERVVLLEHGRVTQHGAVREVIAAPLTDFGAALAGVNRVAGDVRGGQWHAGSLVLPYVASEAANGVATAYIAPGDIRLDVEDAAAATAAPLGVGEWRSRVVRLDPTLTGVRVFTEAPALAVDVSIARVAALTLRVGTPVRLRIDPAAVRFSSGEHRR